jgi:hypothetical protein
VAEQVGVDRKTVYRWRRKPTFARELEQRRRVLRSAAMDRLNALLPGALEVIGQQMDDTMTDHAFRAAALVLKTAVAAAASMSAARRRCKARTDGPSMDASEDATADE